MFNSTHRRYNPLTDEWVLVSPHRGNRPWQGQTEGKPNVVLPEYDSECYLCAGNQRAGGIKNPLYSGPYVFENDFSAIPVLAESTIFNNSLLRAKSEHGVCKVLCFSENHSKTVPHMVLQDVKSVIQVWIDECKKIAQDSKIKHIQIFENKGSVMGCSNPHPHCQIWAQENIPTLVLKEDLQQKNYKTEHKKTLLIDYLKQELATGERVVYENDSFVVLVPFWAVWPFETLLLPKNVHNSICTLSKKEVLDFADAYKSITCKYDNLFEVSFPYSAGIHQAPFNTDEIEHWQWHMHFFPPLFRSAEVKKFMVGYEMMAEPQRDITPEYAAKILQNLSTTHYSQK